MTRALITIIAFAFLFLQTHVAHALSVENIRFGAHGDKTRMVLDLTERADFRVFTLDGPYRLVVDLPSFKWNSGALDSPQNASIKAVRHGALNTGISRIVFDLKSPVKVTSAFSLPKAEGKPDRLVIDFKGASRSEFQAETNNIMGTLSVDGRLDTEVSTQQYASRTLAPKPAPPAKTASGKKPLIILDPGHGGQDPGAIGPDGIHEKTVVLNLAKELKRQLEGTGRYRVLMTRETDVYIKLNDRVKFARQNNADLFVSLHADSIHKKDVKGASVYTLSEKASDAQTAKLAARENRSDIIAGVDLDTEDDEVANILVDLAMRDTMNQSNYFAEKLVGNFKSNGVEILERPHRSAGFAVLKAPDIPSILVEAGFMSNVTEARKLTGEAYRKKVAEAVRKGIDQYMDIAFENGRM